MKTQHTPGPRDDFLGKSNGRGPVRGEQSEADARLMAAAPISNAT